MTQDGLNADAVAQLRREAVEFFVAEEVLKFGDFTLRSGRKSPYFFNSGSLCSARQLARLGQLYARQLQLVPSFQRGTVVFGSAYKGIPIAVATACALAAEPGWGEWRSVSDRKEAKTHGDASAFLGVLRAGDRAVIVDDVITTGGTKVEAIEKLRAAGCETLGLIIAFDRAERLEGAVQTAREAFTASRGLPVYALASLADVAAARPEWREKLQASLPG